MSKRSYILLGLVLVVTTLCFLIKWERPVEIDDPPAVRGGYRGYTIINFPLTEFEEDKASPISFDASKEYRLEFGRGGGARGFDTIAINDGVAILHREGMDHGVSQYWEKAELKLSADELVKIAEVIDELKLTDLHRAYHADVYDGCQWALLIEQDGQSKSVYFNNHFPEPIQEFALRIDQILKEAGFDELKWKRQPAGEARSHDKKLWDSLNR